MNPKLLYSYLDHPDHYRYYQKDPDYIKLQQYSYIDQQEKQRLMNMVIKVCAECEQEKHHDPDDFLCIDCRALV